MDYSEHPAPPPLDSVVRCFWFLRGDLGVDAPETVVPDGRLEIVLHLAEPFSRMEPGTLARRQPRAILSGQLTAPIDLRPNGYADIVGVRFRTAGAAAVVPAPLDELTDRVDSLAGLVPGLEPALFDAVAPLESPAERTDALVRVLSRFVLRDGDELAAAAIRALGAAHAPRVADVADRLGVSARTIERRVAGVSGLAPSLLRRVLRFRRVFPLLESAPRRRWARVAARAGYFDQAHLIRDFRQFAGAPPTAFFRREHELARAILGGDDLPA